MLPGILGTLVFALAAYGASIVALPRAGGDEAPGQVAARLLVGSACLILLLHALVQFATGVVAAWAALGLVAVGLVAIRFVARATSPVPTWRALGRIDIALLAAFLVVVVWRLWPTLSIGHLTTFEGTGNHDEVHYVLVAEWLLQHSARAPVAISADVPWPSAAEVALHLIPRYGAELVLVFVSALTGFASYQAYPVAMVIGSLLWLAAAAMLVQQVHDASDRVNAVAIAIAAASPVAAYMVANGNLATLYGCAFLAGYSSLLLRAIEAERPWRDAVAAGVLLGATLVTYGEVVPLAGVVTIVIAAFALADRLRPVAWIRLRPVAVAAATSLLVAPFAVMDTLRLVLLNMQFVGSRLSAPYWDSMFEGRGPARALLTLTTLAPELVASLPGIVATLVAVAGIAVVASALSRRLLFVTGPLLTAGVVFFCFAVATQFGYGKLKAIQVLSIPLAVLVGFGIAKGLAGAAARSLRGVATAACAAVFAAFLAYVLATTFAAWRNVALAKHVSRDLVGLSLATPRLPLDAVVFVSDRLGDHAFMNSRWIALFMRDTRLVFAPELIGGGYIYGLQQGYPARVQRVTHLLTGTNAQFAAPGRDPPTLQNASFLLQPLPAQGGLAELSSGFHGDEAGTRWMDQAARIRVFGSGARRLRVEFLHRYPGASGQEAVTVLTQTGDYAMASKGGIGLMEIVIPQVRLENAQSFALAKGAGVIDIALPAFAVQDVEIRSELVAASPRERGESTDPRRLTFRVGRIEVLP